MWGEKRYGVISVICPKCSEEMVVPESLSGRAESCPGCGNVCGVPLTLALREAMKPRRRRWWWTLAVAVLLVGVGIAAVAWMRRDTSPVTVASRSVAHASKRGRFPPAAAMKKFFKKHGYHPLVTGDPTTTATVAGRRLHRRLLAYDATDDTTFLRLWSPLDDDSRIVAVSAALVLPSDSTNAVAQGHSSNIRLSHIDAFFAAAAEISGLTREGALSNLISGPDRTDIYGGYTERSIGRATADNGFELEVRRTLKYTGNELGEANMWLILTDSEW